MGRTFQFCKLYLFCLTCFGINNLSAQATKTNLNLSEDFQVLYSADYSANITVKIKVLKKSCPEESKLWVLYDGYLTDKDLYIKFKINYIDCDNVKRYQIVSLPIGKRNLDFSDIWGDKGKNKNIYEKLDNNASILGIVGNSHDIDFTYFPGIELGYISDIELSSQYIAVNKKVDALEPASFVEVLNSNGTSNYGGNKALFGSTISLKPIGGNLIPNSNWVWYKSNSVAQPLSNSIYNGNVFNLSITDSSEYIDLYVRAEGPNNIKTSFTKVQVWIDYSEVLTSRADYLFNIKEIEKAKKLYQDISKKTIYNRGYLDAQIQLCDNYLIAQKEYRYSETHNNSNSKIKIDIANLLELEAGKTEKGNINCTLNFQATNQDKKEFSIQTNDPKFKYYFIRDNLNAKTPNYANPRLNSKTNLIPVNAKESYSIDFKWSTKEITCYKTSRGWISYDSATNASDNLNNLNIFRNYIIKNWKGDLNHNETYRISGSYYIVSDGFQDYYYQAFGTSFSYVKVLASAKGSFDLAYGNISYPNGTYTFVVKTKTLNQNSFNEVTLKGKYFSSGPSNFLLSMLMPGTGNKRVSNNYKIGKRITKSFITLSLISAVAYRYSALKYNEYKNAVDQPSMENAYYQSNLANKIFISSATLAASIYISDIVYVFFKGVSNKKKFNSIRLNTHESVRY
jgi:hypothetical protein